MQPAGAAERVAGIGGPLPEHGDGAMAAIRELSELGNDAATRSSGPRFFHFVTGGATPAALAADWLASSFDQSPNVWEGTPLASRLETVSLAWLRELFGLPAEWGGVLTTGATMANFAGLAAARSWWGERHGVDVDEGGLAGLPAVPVFSSGYIHSSALKALALLGIGRKGVTTFSRDDVGRLDLAALEAALKELGGAPAILIANAGDVNSGDFDPIDAMADLAEAHGAWLHVDGAFGLFARATPQAAGLAAGMERADSVISDGHKWLNVPYDCGFAFVRDELAARAGVHGRRRLPAATRRTSARTTASWARRPHAARAPSPCGRRCAPTVARATAPWSSATSALPSGWRPASTEQPELELLAEAKLNIVCFRLRPDGVPEGELDDLNRRLGAMVLADGRVYFGTTVYGGRVAFRPAIVNWRTTERDVDLLLDVVLELARELLASRAAV